MSRVLVREEADVLRNVLERLGMRDAFLPPL
jgi:hypothetical protein